MERQILFSRQEIKEKVESLGKKNYKRLRR